MVILLPAAIREKQVREWQRTYIIQIKNESKIIRIFGFTTERFLEGNITHVEVLSKRPIFGYYVQSQKAIAID